MEMTFGEWFVVIFLFLAVVSAPYWPKVSERVFVALARQGSKPPRAGSDQTPR